MFFLISPIVAQSQLDESRLWKDIVEKLNFLENINASNYLSYKNALIKSISKIKTPPGKQNIDTILTNSSKLVLIESLAQLHKILWADNLFKTIDARKLNRNECRILFELEILALTKYPERNLSPILMESLKVLLNQCKEEIKQNPSNLHDLYDFYISKQMFLDAIILTPILWNEEESLFHVGSLHQKLYQLRWDEKDSTHLNQAKENFGLLLDKFPTSIFVPATKLNLILLESETRPIQETIHRLKINTLQYLDAFTKEQIDELLYILSPYATNASVIEYLKDWFTRINKEGVIYPYTENILKFLYNKSGLKIEALADLYPKTSNSQKKLPPSFEVATIEQKVQYLAFWNSLWSLEASTLGPYSSISVDSTNKKAILKYKSIPNATFIFSLDLKQLEKLPNYIFLEITSIEPSTIISLEFLTDYKSVFQENIVCTNKKKLIRIEINPEDLKATSWYIKIKNLNKSNVSTLLIYEPNMFYIQTEADLDKKIK